MYLIPIYDIKLGLIIITNITLILIFSSSSHYRPFGSSKVPRNSPHVLAWDAMHSHVLRTMETSMIKFFSWPIAQSHGCFETITCHYRSTQLRYILWTPWCVILTSFEVGRIPLHVYVPSHCMNRKAILLGTQWLTETLVKQLSQAEPTASSLVTQALVYGS